MIDNIEANNNTLNEQSIPNAEKNDFVSETDQLQHNEQCLPNAEENEFVQQIDPVQQNKRGRKKNEGLKTRKRLSNSKAWVRNVEKEKKTKGLEYVNTKSKIIKKKSLLPPCSCRMKCFEKFSSENREIIFNNYYNLPRESQQQFIASSVIETDKKVQRVRKNKEVESRRKYSRLYFLSKGSENIKVCQLMFLNTLSVTLKQVRNTVEKKRSTNSGMCKVDNRGKHGNHKKINENDKEMIRNHIKMFPAVESHYSRAHSEKTYLNPDLSISQMYRLYVSYCKDLEIVALKEAIYRKIFVEEFNMSFKKPNNDTCQQCDKYEMIMKSTTDEETREFAKIDKIKHLEMAEESYEEKKKDKYLSKTNSKVLTISFDLQKCLPTPMLMNGVSFYKRQLWTLNLTMYETTIDQSRPICYLWDETIAARGGQEIASCLFKHIFEEVKEDIEIINFYSDCCPGQNRNIYITIMLLQVVNICHARQRQLTINHKFLQPGHTHMEADSIHALIEKTKKKSLASIEVPRDWVNLIRMIHRTPPIKVQEMVQSEFFNFKKLLSTSYVHRKFNNKNEAVSWNKIKWIQYRTSSPGIMFYKYSFGQEEFLELHLERKSTRKSVETNIVLEPISTTPLPLPTEKIKDLKSLMPYIHPNSRQYYESFMNNLVEGNPESSDED